MGRYVCNRDLERLKIYVTTAGNGKLKQRNKRNKAYFSYIIQSQHDEIMSPSQRSGLLFLACLVSRCLPLVYNLRTKTIQP